MRQIATTSSAGTFGIRAGRILAGWWIPIALVLLGPCFWFVAESFAGRLDLTNHSIFKFWLAGRMIAEGQSPYDAELWTALHKELGARWIPERIFLYPPALAYLLVPLGQLGLHAAFVSWGTGLLLSVAASIFLLAQRWNDRGTRPFALFILFASFFYTPLLMSLSSSTPSGVFLLLLSLAVYLPADRPSFWRGFLTGALLLKPSLGVPVCGVVGLWMLTRRDWPGVAGVLASATLILAVSFHHDPWWVAKFIEENREHLDLVVGRQPTLLNAIIALGSPEGSYANMVTAAAWAVLFARVVHFVVSKARVLSPLTVSSLAVTWTLIATPYVWPYDYLLLLLPFVWICDVLLVSRSSPLPPAIFLIFVVGLTYSLMPGTAGPQTQYVKLFAIPALTYLLIEVMTFAFAPVSTSVNQGE